MKCTKCSFELEDGAAVCPNCGTKIENRISETYEKNPEEVLAHDDRPDERVESIDTAIKATVEKSSNGSISCRECGAENNAEDRFCYACGKPLGQGETSKNPKRYYCPNCGTANDSSDLFCSNCGTSFVKGGTAAGKKSPLKGIQRYSAKYQSGGITGMKLPPKGVTKAIIAIVAVIALFFIVKGIFFSGKGNYDELIYLRDNELMRYAEPANIEIDDGIIDEENDPYDMYVNHAVMITDDGTKLFYPTDYNGYSYDLRITQLDKKSDEGIKIDSDIINYSLLGNDSLVYIKDSAEHRLYVADLYGNKTKIDSEVEYFWLSEDKTRLLWKTNSSDDNRLYFTDMESNTDKHKIDSNVTQIVAKTDDFSKIYYMKGDSLFEVADFENKAKIASDIMNCWSNEDGDNLIIYYSKRDGKNLSELLTDDDKAKEDASMKEPDITDYQHTETKDSFWGPQEQVVTDDSYYKEVEKYEKKLERDRIRDSIDDVMEYRLACYSYSVRGETTKLTGDYGWVDDETDDTGVIYYTIDPEKIEKTKLSKLAGLSEEQLRERFSKALRSGATAHLRVFGEDVALDIDLENYSLGDMFCDRERRMAYITVYDYGMGEPVTGNYEVLLYKTNYSTGNGALEKVCDDYSEYSVSVVDGVLYYICERDNNGSGDLYANGERIASDVYSVTIMPENIGIMFWTERDNKGAGTLNIFNGKTAKRISDDVYTAKSDSKGNLAFLTDYSSTKYRGDLKMYKAGEIINIDSDVSSIVYFD